MFIDDPDIIQTDQLALMFQAVESATNGIVMTDPNKPDNPIIYTNPAFTHITGYSAAEILGHNCRFLQGEDKDQPALTELRNAIKEQRATTVVLRNYRKDGTKFFNELTVSPVRNDSGRLVAFVGVQNDITARIEAEQRISDFYSIVSHELRTPIAKIKSALSVISDGEAGPIGDTVKRFVDISAKSAESLWKLIENILDFKKLESGKFRLLKQNIAIADLVSVTVAEYRLVANESGVDIECNCLCKANVDGDAQRIVQVLENLLSNAVKFSPPNSKVIVTLRKMENQVRIEVADQGPGIASADIPKLFEKFQQIEVPDHRARGGTGLGLAICKAIVEAHEGSVGVSTALGQGSVFWFELPTHSPSVV